MFKKSFVSFLFLVLALSFFSFTATQAIAGYHYYGVNETNRNGDVFFQYHNGEKFVELYCSKYIWDIGPYSGNPNSWLNWYSTKYEPNYQGWFLAVPTRVRWWFFFKYWDHIDNYLGIKTKF